MNMETGPEAVLGIPFARNSYPMWIYDCETFAFLEVNNAAIRQYGYSREEFLRMSIRDIRPTADVPELLRQTDTPRPLGKSTAERWRHQAKSGTVFEVTITSWELTFCGCPAEMVLARREGPQ